ncbi:hypothetical protein KAW65_01005 [candidate division WOR-3 bacterium]|nr:hypothetical protein [candidate division WOR-3 bacterium]
MRLKRFNIKWLWLVGVLVVVQIVVFYPSFNYYFFQDDFICLERAIRLSLGDVFKFWNPNPEWSKYRPLLYVQFKVLNNLFGLNPIPWRVGNLLFHIINSILVYCLVSLIAKNKRLSYLTSFFFCLSSVQFICVFWICVLYFDWMISLFLLTLIFYLKGREKKWIVWLSLICYTLSLLATRNTIIIPIILFAYEIIILYKEWKKITLRNVLKIIKIQSPYYVITFVFLFIQFAIVKLPSYGPYKFYFPGFWMIKHFVRYGYWTLESIGFYFLKDMIKGLFIPGLHMYDFLNQHKYLFSVIFVISLLVILILVIRILRRVKKEQLSLLVFWIAWIPIGLLPTVFIKYQVYPHYLIIPFIGFSFLLAFLIDRICESKFKRAFSKNVFLTVILFLYFAHSCYFVRANEKRSGITRGAVMAKEVLYSLEELYPVMPPNQNLVFFNMSKWVIGGNSGVRVFYDDYSLNVYAEKEFFHKDGIAYVDSIKLNMWGKVDANPKILSKNNSYIFEYKDHCLQDITRKYF